MNWCSGIFSGQSNPFPVGYPTARCRNKVKVRFPAFTLGRHRATIATKGNLLTALYTYPYKKNRTKKAEKQAEQSVFVADTLPLASLHSGEKPTAQRERRRSEQPPPTDGGSSQRKFSTAEPTPYVVRRTSCCAVL